MNKRMETIFDNHKNDRYHNLSELFVNQGDEH